MVFFLYFAAYLQLTLHNIKLALLKSNMSLSIKSLHILKGKSSGSEKQAWAEERVPPGKFQYPQKLLVGRGSRFFGSPVLVEGVE